MPYTIMDVAKTLTPHPEVAAWGGPWETALQALTVIRREGLSTDWWPYPVAEKTQEPTP